MIESNVITFHQPQRLLSDGLVASAITTPDKTVAIVEDKSYSYRELYDAAQALALKLVASGIEKGDRVVIYMDNTWPCFVSIYGALLAGGVFVVVNPQTKSEKLEYVLNDCQAKALLSDNHLSKVFLSVVNKIPSLNVLIASGDFESEKADIGVSAYTFEEVLETEQAESILPVVIPNDLAALIYTSGSTGNPKGVMQTHQSMVFAAWSLIEYQRLSENDKIMLVLPIAFDYGLYQLLMTVKLGATIILERSFTFPAKIYKSIEDNGATVFPAVPTIFAMMISSHKKKKLSFPSITRITNTAAALPGTFISTLHEIFPSALIYKMYGLTECKRVCYLEPELVDKHPTSVGRAIPGTEVYLLSPEGEEVKAGEEGILYVRGPHIMLGYWNQPELSAEMLKPGKLPGERVLCTHDLFRMDEEGLLYFVGRSDDIIKTRGEKVSPIEVENALHALQGIKEVAIVGIPDDILGSALRAYIVKDPASDIDLKTIKKYCLAHLENFLVPQEIIFLDVLPKSQNGKIDKKQLLRQDVA